MSAAHRTRLHCRRCGGRSDRVGEMSYSGLCQPCGPVALLEYELSAAQIGGVPWLRSQAASRRYQESVRARAAVLDLS